MPMRSESSSSTLRTFTCANGGPSYGITQRDGRDRSQYGYRSGPLDEVTRRTLEEHGLTRYNATSYIKLLEEEAWDNGGVGDMVALDHRDRVWPVHDRDYEETRYRPTGFNLSWTAVDPWYGRKYHYTSQGCMGTALLPASVLPDPGTEYSLYQEAASMLRRSRPPSEGFDLARFAGEQRELPMLLKASNYRPRNKRELGGAYLNWLFGIKPTGSDLGYLAELILSYDGPLQSLLANEKVREKAYNTRVLLKDNNSGNVRLTSYSNQPTGGSYWTGLIQTKLVFPGKTGTSSSSLNVLFPNLKWSYTRKQILRTFATWEYFIPKPHEFEGRLRLAKRKATELLSAGKTNESTVWELAPWTWMTDWFIDIGGLIRYQEAVRDNQIVASACGYSLWEEFATQVHFTDHTHLATAGSYPYYGIEDYKFSPVMHSVLVRKHMRRSGNPYSLGPTWDLNPSQWAITSALGLSRGVDLPNKRV